MSTWYKNPFESHCTIPWKHIRPYECLCIYLEPILWIKSISKDPDLYLELYGLQGSGIDIVYLKEKRGDFREVLSQNLILQRNS